MSKLLDRIDSLQNGMQKLFKQQESLKHKNNLLLKQNEDLKEERDQLLKKLDDLNARQSALKTANAMLGSKTFKTETKLKINTLIKEIDMCIAHIAD